LAEEIVAIVVRFLRFVEFGVGPLAAVEPPAVDAVVHQRSMFLPPPAANSRMKEINVALALMIVGRRRFSDASSLVSLLE
jgi:hypothetical protein